MTNVFKIIVFSLSVTLFSSVALYYAFKGFMIIAPLIGPAGCVAILCGLIVLFASSMLFWEKYYD